MLGHGHAKKCPIALAPDSGRCARLLVLSSSVTTPAYLGAYTQVAEVDDGKVRRCHELSEVAFGHHPDVVDHLVGRAGLALTVVRREVEKCESVESRIGLRAEELPGATGPRFPTVRLTGRHGQSVASRCPRIVGSKRIAA